MRLEHCTSATFLVSVQEAALTGKLSSNNCSGAAGTLVSQGPVKLRILTQLGSVVTFFLWRLEGRRWSGVSVAGSLDCRFVVCSAKEISSLTRLVRRKSGIAIGTAEHVHHFWSAAHCHSPCAIIYRLQSQIVQIRGAISYYMARIRICNSTECNGFQHNSSNNLLIPNTRHMLTSNPSRIGDIGDIPLRKKVMSRAPVVEGSQLECHRNGDLDFWHCNLVKVILN